MKIAIWAYLDNNIGDDLMIKLLVEEFKDVTFYLYEDNSVLRRTFSKFDNVVLRNKSELSKDTDDIQLFLSIGGSIFNNLNTVRGKVSRLLRIRMLRKLKRKGLKMATIGCNLGPYTDNLGIRLTIAELKLNELVTVRDYSSYKILSESHKLNNFHLGDDIVYNLKNDGNSIRRGLGITAYRSVSKEENN